MEKTGEVFLSKKSMPGRELGVSKRNVVNQSSKDEIVLGCIYI